MPDSHFATLSRPDDAFTLHRLDSEAERDAFLLGAMAVRIAVVQESVAPTPFAAERLRAGQEAS